MTSDTAPIREVERLLGRPPSEWTAEDLATLIRDHGVRLISLMHVGADGWIKTLDFLPRSSAHVRDILNAGERADGSSLFAEAGIPTKASDIVLRPRLDTAFFSPFSEVPALVFLCEHLGRDGSPLPQSPDTIVRAAHQRFVAETGAELWALGEVEYFLGKRADEGDVYGQDDTGYHASSPFVFGEPLRRKAMVLLGELGIAVKYGHSEVGYIEAGEGEEKIWEQHEIELALAPLPQAADAIVLAQWILRNLARAGGMQCSFRPILMSGHAGSGLHFHLSVVRDGRHLEVAGASGPTTPEAKWLIGGLVRMGGALMAFGNRTSESFQRLEGGAEVPEAVRWGQFNRKALVRLPIQARSADGETVTVPTVEFRLPDGSVHPHLLLAGVVQAVLASRSSDLDALLEATRAAEGAGGAVEGMDRIPGSFPEVADLLEKHRSELEAGGVFPASLIDRALERLRQAG